MSVVNGVRSCQVGWRQKTPLPALTCKICDPGQFAPALGAQCVSCPPDTFSSGYTALGQCAACPLGQSTYGASGSTSASACRCPAGMEQGPDGACAGCPVSTYSVNGTCTACPANSLATAGATSATSCRCDNGYKWADGVCEPCPKGTYWAGANSACRACPTGSTTADVASKSVLFCGMTPELCLPGFEFAGPAQGCVASNL